MRSTNAAPVSGKRVHEPAVRRATLAESTELLGARPLIRANDPETGIRLAEGRAVARTDCGWLV